MKNSNVLAFILICISILSVLMYYRVTHSYSPKVTRTTTRVGDVAFTGTDERLYTEYKRSGKFSSKRYALHHHIVTFVSADGTYTFEKDYYNDESFDSTLPTIKETRTVFRSLTNEYIVGKKSNMTYEDLKEENRQKNMLNNSVTLAILLILLFASGGWFIKIIISKF